MVQYKLTYFNIKALAEPIRWILKYGGLEFEDIRVEREDWPKLKPSMPLEQMPVLEVDGVVLHQHIPIMRYLASITGLAGKEDWENLQIDIAVATVNDFRGKLGDAGYEQDRKVKDEKLAALNSNILPFYLSRLEAIAKENDGHLALKRRTWADLYFASLYEYMNWMTEQDILANYPNLKKIVDDITSVENIKKWIAERPVTAS